MDPRLRGGRYRRRIGRLALVLVAAVLLAGCGDDPSATEERAQQVAGAARDAGLTDEVAEVLADATRGTDGTFRVTYEVADPAGGDEPQRLTVTQQPPRRRLDVERADGTADATIATGEATYQCTSAGGSWRCDQLRGAPAPGGLFGDDVIDSLTEALTRDADDYEFTVEARDVLGVEARCLLTTRRAGTAEDPSVGTSATLCLSPEGARLLTEVPAGTLRAIAYTTDIPADAFELPADPA